MKTRNVIPAALLAVATLGAGYAAVADTAQMPELAITSGCIACHNIDKKVVGPPWRDVALRYKGDADARSRLIAKVKAGGKGNWTEITGGVPMPPYSPRVTDEDIAKLVDFVLALE